MAKSPMLAAAAGSRGSGEPYGGRNLLSYRRADEAWARLLHAQLRAEGVEAWYDAQVGAGQDWRIAAAKALEASQIFVLLFSENAAQSSDIAKELAAATLEKKLIIPVRLQDIAPKGAFLYELASRNWVNAYDDTEAKLAELAKGIAHLVKTGARDESVLPFDRSNEGHTPAAARNRQAADVFWAMGQNDAALKILEPMDSDQARNLVLAKVYATAERYAQAADTLRAIPAPDQYSRQTLDDAARLIQSAPGGASNALPAFGGVLNFIYLFVGAQDRYLEAAESRLQAGLDGGLPRDPWAPSSASLRKMERFKAFAHQTGFVDYWRARGWPDACHPVSADDFACK